MKAKEQTVTITLEEYKGLRAYMLDTTVKLANSMANEERWKGQYNLLAYSYKQLTGQTGAKVKKKEEKHIGFL